MDRSHTVKGVALTQPLGGIRNMQVALYLTILSAPRLYGVDVVRVLDPDSLRVMAAKADVLITDTSFDPAVVPVKQCCVLKGAPGIELFAKENGYDCIEKTQIISWFQKRVGLDVSRRARQATPTTATPTMEMPRASKDNAQYKAMYDGLVAELRRSDLYKNLDPSDAKTYDILLQAIRGTLRKADSVAGDMALAQSKLVKAEAELARLTKERNATVEDIEAVLSGLTQAVNSCADVLDEISNLPDDPELVLFGSVAVKAKASLGLASKFSSVVRAKELRAIGSVSREFIASLIGVTEDLLTLSVDAVKASSGAQSASQQAALVKANAEKEMRQLRLLLEQEQKLTDSLKQQLEQLNEAYQEQLVKATEAENQLLLAGGTTNIAALQEQLRTLRLELQSKNELIARMEEATANSDFDDTTDLLSPEVATGIIRQLRTQVAALKLERDRATAELMKAKKVAAKEAERAETLTASARSLSQVAFRGAQVSALPLFNYTAKALIIPVFGNGSAGISSSAVSLAKTLGVNARAVLLDFDLVTTDLEGRFGEPINPLIKLDDGEISGKNSAMGLFIDKGKDFFASHYAELVIRIDSNKAGILDYLPGFYAKPDLFMLTQADYSTLLNYLGARYDYIIIDAGKIGCSEIGDQILRNFCLACFRALIVTDASPEKTRAMRLKLNDVFGTELRKFAERCVWMTNRAVKRVDLTRFTAPAMSVSVPVLPEMVGIHESFHVTGAAQREFNKVVRALAGV